MVTFDARQFQYKRKVYAALWGTSIATNLHVNVAKYRDQTISH